MGFILCVFIEPIFRGEWTCTLDQRNKCPSSEAVLFLFSSDALLTFGRSSKNSLPEEFFYSCFVAPEKLFQYPFETSKSFCRHICG